MLAALGAWLLMSDALLALMTASAVRELPRAHFEADPLVIGVVGLLAPVAAGAGMLAAWTLGRRDARLRLSTKRPRRQPWRTGAARESGATRAAATTVVRGIAVIGLALGLPMVAASSCVAIGDQASYSHRMYFEATVPAGLPPGATRADVEQYLRAAGMDVRSDAAASRVTADSDDFPYGPCPLRVTVTVEPDAGDRASGASGQAGGSCL